MVRDDKTTTINQEGEGNNTSALKRGGREEGRKAKGNKVCAGECS